MISLFTPTHDSSFLPQIWKSLQEQTCQNFEWTIVYNNGAQPIGFTDARIREVVLPVAPEWVGPLKAFACEQCKGDILLEMDHDDLLMPTAVEETAKAFNNPNVGFVYSNTIHATEEFKPVNRFNEAYGWKYRPANYKGHELDEHISFGPTPSCVSRIWFAPNHLRAFRRSVYEQIGGYAKNMRVLDDLDLMARMYQATEFHHIDQGLYLYRVHGQNTWLKNNTEIQQNVHRIHDHYIQDLAARWSDLNGLLKLDLGGRFARKDGFTSVDLLDADVIADLNHPWPFESGSVGALRAYDIFEHLRDPLHTMKELYRVLAPGGYAFIQVPSTDGRGAWADPTHVSYWNEASFAYYTEARKARYIDTPVRFQAMRLFTTEKNADGICWTVAHLLKLDESIPRPPGLIHI